MQIEVMISFVVVPSHVATEVIIEKKNATDGGVHTKQCYRLRRSPYIRKYQEKIVYCVVHVSLCVKINLPL